MKKTLLRFLAALCPALLSAGCVVSEKVYVQDASVIAPTPSLPVRVTEEVMPMHLTISPVFAVGKGRTIHGKVGTHSPVNAAGVYAVDTVRNGGGVELVPGNNGSTFEGANMRWSSPDVTAGLGLDLPVSPSIALSGGVLYSSAESRDLWGGYLGMGIMGGGTDVGVRVDGGLLWNPSWYRVSTIVERTYHPFLGSPYTRALAYRDDGQGSGGPGWYLGLTMNARRSDWPVRPFLNLAASRVEFFSFSPAGMDPLLLPVTSEGDDKAEGAVTVFSVAPGVSIPLGSGQRILAGVRWSFAPAMASDQGSDGVTRMMPFLQIDVTF